MAADSLTAQTAPAATLSASQASLASLAGSTGTGQRGGYPAAYGATYPQGALALAAATMPAGTVTAASQGTGGPGG